MSDAWRIVSQSDLLPMRMPTSGAGVVIGGYFTTTRPPSRPVGRVPPAGVESAAMKPLALPLAALLVVATPLVAQSPAQRIRVDYSQFTLPNGLHVIIH